MLVPRIKFFWFFLNKDKDVLVASKRVVPRLCDLTQEEIADLFQTVVKVQAAVEREHNATSSTVVVQDGKEAGQTIRVSLIFHQQTYPNQCCTSVCFIKLS